MPFHASPGTTPPTATEVGWGNSRLESIRSASTARLVWLVVLPALVTAELPPRPAAAQPPEITPVCAIQGDGFTSPLEGATVTTEGVVTADFIDTEVGGFYLQAPDCDGSPATSDGVLVFTFSETEVSVAAGDLVRVTGEVKEYYGMTEVVAESAGSVVKLGTAGVPEPANLEPPTDVAAARAYFEQHEGMHVALPPQRVIGATNAHGEPYVMPADVGVERVYRDDAEGRTVGLKFPWGWRALDHGDEVTGITGGLNYTFGNYKVDVAADTELVVTPADAPVPSIEPGLPEELTVATYNVENFFDTIDDPGKDDAGSSPSPERYPIDVARRARSIGAFLGAPDLVGLQEVESERVLQDLVSHPELAGADYEYLIVDGPDGRGIDVAFLYKPSSLRLLSHGAPQACLPEKPFGEGPSGTCELPDGGLGFPLFSRPPLVARFWVEGTDARLVVIVNHYKSKRGGDLETTPVRSDMSRFVLGLVEEQRSADPGAEVIVLGDLNEFPEREPIGLLEASGLTNLHDRLEGDRPFTYVFNGVSQILDYIFVSDGLDSALKAVEIPHVNTDFGAPPPDIDDDQNPRTSDHDPIIARFERPGRPYHPIWLPVLMRAVNPAELGGPVELPTATATSTLGPGPGPAPAYPLRITELFYDGDVPRVEADEYLEFENVSDSEVALAGWQVISVRGDQRFSFPSEASIGPSQHCRLYTDLNEAVPPGLPCSFDWDFTTAAVWRNDGDKAEIRDAAGELIDHRCYGDHAAECEG